VPEAVKLARAVELARLRGKEGLPTDAVLAALRPRLREARAPRVPTLRRLVVQSFEDFLIDGEDDPRLPGRIARAVIAPWWRGVTEIAGAELRPLEQALAALYAEDFAVAPDGLAPQAQAAAAGWTRTLVEELAKPHVSGSLRKIFPRSGLVADVKTIATLLSFADALGAAFADIDRMLAMAGKLVGRQIVDLVPEAVTMAKQHYLSISEAPGVQAVFLALALLNRLRYPWQILRLGRALSWKPNDSLLRDTEFGPVGERLILGLTRSAHDIAHLAGFRGEALDVAPIAAAIADYMEDAEGLLGEFGFRRDSPWGEAILLTRVVIADALDREFLAHVGNQMLSRILPVERRSGVPRGFSPDADLRAPPAEAAVAEAMGAARLFMLLLHRGSRHGFGQPVREIIDSVALEIDRRAGMLLDALRETPDHAVIEAQIAAAVEVLDVLFDDGRGTTLSRRLSLARQAV
jgi:hypothetical protein